jgi:hypothetical protein
MPRVCVFVESKDKVTSQEAPTTLLQPLTLTS